MKGVFLAILLLYAQALFAQKVISIPITSKGDTGLWYRYKMKEARGLGLADLRTSTHPFHIRLWTAGQVVDIWSLDGINYSGERTTYRYHRSGKKERLVVYKEFDVVKDT